MDSTVNASHEGDASERLLDVAERLFMESGYAAVRLKHIAEALKIKQASLYYHFPGGKEEIFVAVVRRNLIRHRQGVEGALAEAGPDWVDQLTALAYWLLSQHPMDLMRLVNADMPSIEPEAAAELMRLFDEALLRPVRELLEEAMRQKLIVESDAALLAGTFLAMISSLHIVQESWTPRSRQDMADELIRVLVNGLKPR